MTLLEHRVEDTEFGTVETALGRPHPRLRHLVEVYHGYRENVTGNLLRLEVPFPGVPLILGFGAEIGVSSTGYEEDLEPGYGGFVAGLSSRPALVETNGSQAGVQVNLTPLGAYQLFGPGVADLAGRAVHLGDVLGRPGAELVERLRDCRGWEERFELLDRVFLRALSLNEAPSEAIAWAWGQIEHNPGGVSIRGLADAIGWSHKHLIARFRAEVGVAPRLASRIVRFDRAVKLVESGDRHNWPAIAVDCGYYDQAHMAREFREFARCSPRELRARRLPVGGVRG